jgi:hypothetical protein
VLLPKLPVVIGTKPPPLLLLLLLLGHLLDLTTVGLTAPFWLGAHWLLPNWLFWLPDSWFPPHWRLGS